MQFEVEQKHRIDDVAQFVARLTARGLTLGAAREQSDRYFAHPCRDFVETDEALRIRTTGGKSFLTYKGPKLAGPTKTRRELELPLHAADAAGTQFAELLTALGFMPVAVVNKKRRAFQLVHGERMIEGALDEFDELGAFVELELAADETYLDQAKELISTLADELDLGPSERRSYLEMLLEARSRHDN